MRAAITPSRPVMWLAALIALLSAAVASYGLASWSPGGSPETLTLRGERVFLFGRGLYRYDTLLNGAGFAGVDVVTLALAIPLLTVAVMLYRRGSVRGSLLLTGTLAYFLYNYASMAFGAAYNETFLAYVAIFSASLFALIATWASIDLDRLPMHISPRLPRWTIALYLIAVATFLAVAWGGDVIWSLATGHTPTALGSYTTVVTYVLDLGVVAPTLILAALLLIRGSAVGLLLASTMLTLMFTIGTALIAQSAAIVVEGVPLTRAAIVGLVVSFGILCVIGIVLAAVLLRCVSDAPVPDYGKFHPRTAPALC